MMSFDLIPKVVSEMLGPSTISTTMDIYSHVSLDLQKEAALKLEQGLKRHKANGKPTLFEPVADQGWITWRLGDLENAQVVQHRNHGLLLVVSSQPAHLGRRMGSDAMAGLKPVRFHRSVVK